jgi:hypothetical protein
VCKKWLSEKERKVRFLHDIYLFPQKETDFSVRAWRGLRFNEDYALKLERKLVLNREHVRAQSKRFEGPEPLHQNVNPFAVCCD